VVQVEQVVQMRSAKKKGCFLLNSEKHPGENMWGFYLHVKRDDESERQ